jgi:hypothetical protein
MTEDDTGIPDRATAVTLVLQVLPKSVVVESLGTMVK